MGHWIQKWKQVSHTWLSWIAINIFKNGTRYLRRKNTPNDWHPSLYMYQLWKTTSLKILYWTKWSMYMQSYFYVFPVIMFLFNTDEPFQTWVPLYTYLFIYSFIHPFIHSFIHSFVHSLIYLFIYFHFWWGQYLQSIIFLHMYYELWCSCKDGNVWWSWFDGPWRNIAKGISMHNATCILWRPWAPDVDHIK